MSAALKSAALRLLARREHTRAELIRKLSARALPEEILTVLDQLEQAGLLCDARFTEAYIHAHVARHGNTRLRHDLRRRGVDEGIIDAALTVEGDSELERARTLWQRKFAAPPANRNDYARQARFLQGRGFAIDVIRKLLKDTEE